MLARVQLKMLWLYRKRLLDAMLATLLLTLFGNKFVKNCEILFLRFF